MAQTVSSLNEVAAPGDAGNETSSQRPSVVSLVLPTLRCGGAERMTLNLAESLVEFGCDVDLVVARIEGELQGDVPTGVRLVDLGGHRVAASLFPLAGYLKRRQPDALISRMMHMNAVAAAACRMARCKTRLALT